MKAIRIAAVGGPEVLTLEDVAKPAPAAGQAVVKVEAAGLNFIDVYFRKGLYAAPLPYIPGQEGAGVVDAVGEGVKDLKAGDRVAWAGGAQGGGYAQYAAVPAARLIKLPGKLSAKTAAAAMLQGMTAHYLSHSALELKKGDWCVVHAAAGGVGLLLCRMLARLGARVIGTTSTKEKAALARAAGAEEIVFYGEQDLAAEVKRITGGKGARVVYDGVGKDTYLKSLDSLAPRGLLALFGQSSGPVPPLDPQVLSQKGSLFLTRPTLGHYTATREELSWRAGDVLSWLEKGELEIRIDSEFPLERAADAHRALEGRKTAGKVLLIP